MRSIDLVGFLKANYIFLILLFIVLGSVLPILAVLPVWYEKVALLPSQLLIFTGIGLVVLAVILPYYYRMRLDKKRYTYILLSLFIITFGVRIWYVLTHDQMFQSDFRTMWEYAINTYNIGEFVSPILLQEQRALVSLVPMVFMFGISTLVYKIANVLFITISAYIVSLLVKRSVSSHAALLSFALISLIPESYFALLIPTHDIPAIFYMLLYLLIFYYVFFIEKNISYLKLLLLIVPFILIGLLFEIQRGIFVVLVAALLVFYIFMLFSTKVTVKKIIIAFVVMFIPFLSVVATKHVLKEKEIIVKHLKPIIKHGWSFIHPHTFSNGAYGKGVEFYTNYVFTLPNESEIEYYKKAIKLSDIYYNLSQRPSNYLQRSQRLYMLGSQDYFYYTALQNISSEEQSNITKFNHHWNTIFVFIYLFLLVVSISAIVFIQSIRKRINLFIYFPLIFMSTISMALLLMGENQPRYLFMGWFFWSMVIVAFVDALYNKTKNQSDTKVILSLKELVISFITISSFFVGVFLLFKLIFVNSPYRLIDMSKFSSKTNNALVDFNRSLDDKPYSTAKLTFPDKKTTRVNATYITQLDLPQTYQFGLYIHSDYCSISPCEFDKTFVSVSINDTLIKKIALYNLTNYIHINVPVKVANDGKIKIDFSLEKDDNITYSCKKNPIVDFKFLSIHTPLESTNKVIKKNKKTTSRLKPNAYVYSCQTKMKKNLNGISLSFKQKDPIANTKAGVVVQYPKDTEHIVFYLKDQYYDDDFKNRITYKVIYHDKIIFKRDIAEKDFDKIPIELDVIDNDRKVYIVSEAKDGIESGWSWGSVSTIQVSFEE